MDRRTDGRTEGGTDRRTEGRTDGRRERRTEGRMDGRTVVCRSRRTDGRKSGMTDGPDVIHRTPHHHSIFEQHSMDYLLIFETPVN